MPDLTLYEFAFSHYNEKVRWALDYKGASYESVSLLPGFHMGTVRRLTGETETPVLVSGEQVVSNSPRIVEFLEERIPEPALWPTDPKERERADSLVKWLDEEVGVDCRLVLFADVLEDPRLAADLFSKGKSRTKRRAYSLIFSPMAKVLKKEMGVTPEAVQAAQSRLAKALERIASLAADTGYLVGHRFTVADLTAAALLFPTVFPAEIPELAPAQPSAAMDRWMERWKSSPSSEYVRRIYAAHRRGGQAKYS